jgi:hypothetical protein
MVDIEEIIKKLLAELDSMQKTQSKLIDISVDNELNQLLGIENSNNDVEQLDISDTFKLKIATKGNKNEYLLQK